MTQIIYFSVALGVLTVLSAVLYRTGVMLRGCPRVGNQARPTVIVVVTGFAVMGAGVVVLGAAVLPHLGAGTSLYAGVGLALIALGAGFGYAAETLKRVLPTPLPTPEDRRRALKLSNL